MEGIAREFNRWVNQVRGQSRAPGKENGVSTALEDLREALAEINCIVEDERTTQFWDCLTELITSLDERPQRIQTAANRFKELNKTAVERLGQYLFSGLQARTKDSIDLYFPVIVLGNGILMQVEIVKVPESTGWWLALHPSEKCFMHSGFTTRIGPEMQAEITNAIASAWPEAPIGFEVRIQPVASNVNHKHFWHEAAKMNGASIGLAVYVAVRALREERRFFGNPPCLSGTSAELIRDIEIREGLAKLNIAEKHSERIGDRSDGHKHIYIYDPLVSTGLKLPESRDDVYEACLETSERLRDYCNQLADALNRIPGDIHKKTVEYYASIPIRIGVEVRETSLRKVRDEKQDGPTGAPREITGRDGVKTRPIRLSNLVNRAENYLIGAEPGYGKTVASKALARQLCAAYTGTPGSKLPIYLDLRQVKSLPDETQTVASWIANAASGGDGTTFLIRAALERGEAVVVLDALDQCPVRNDLESVLASLIQPVTQSFSHGDEESPSKEVRNRILVFARPYGIDLVKRIQAKRAYMAGFEPSDAGQYIGLLLQSDQMKALLKFSRTPDGRFMARSPLILSYLTLICKTPGALDFSTFLSPAMVYRNILSRFANNPAHRPAQLQNADWTDLGPLCLEMMIRQPKSPQIASDDPLWSDANFAGNQVHLRTWMVNCRLLEQVNTPVGEAYAPAHRSLVEFLAGWELAGRIARDGWETWHVQVMRWCWHPDWQEALVFAGDRLGNKIKFSSNDENIGFTAFDQWRRAIIDEEDTPVFHRLSVAHLHDRVVKNLPEPICLVYSLVRYLARKLRFDESILAATVRIRPQLRRNCNSDIKINKRSAAFDFLSTAEFDELLTRVQTGESEAIISLGRIGALVALPGRAIGALIHQTEQGNECAGRVLGEIGAVFQLPEPAIDALIHQTEQGNRPAARALGEIGAVFQLPEPVINALIHLTEQGNEYAARALGEIGAVFQLPEPVINALIHLTEKGNEYAARALGVIGAVFQLPEPAIDALIHQTEQGNEYAARALGETGAVFQLPEPVINALIHLTEKGNLSAGEALGRIGAVFQLPKPVINALIHLTEKGNLSAGEALGRIGAVFQLPKPAIDALIHLTEQGNEYAAHALGEIGAVFQLPEPVINVLIHETEQRNWPAAGALGKIGAVFQLPKPAIDALIQQTEKGNWSAAGALGRIGAVFQLPEPAIDALIQQTEKRNLSAGGALGEIGAVFQLPEPAIGALIHLTEQGNEYAAHALGEIGAVFQLPEPAIDALIHQTVNGNGYAGRALGEIGAVFQLPKPAIDALIQQTEKGNWSAAGALGEIGAVFELPEPAIDALIQLASPYYDAAHTALGRIDGSKQKCDSLSRLRGFYNEMAIAWHEHAPRHRLFNKNGTWAVKSLAELTGYEDA